MVNELDGSTGSHEYLNMKFFKLFRRVTRPVILGLEKLFNAEPVERPAIEQQKVDEQTRKMSLYQFTGCPYCMATRRAIRRLNLNIEIRDALDNKQHERELIEQGGKRQVPCLRIDEDGQTTWIYESRDIIQYLDSRFGVQPNK